MRACILRFHVFMLDSLEPEDVVAKGTQAIVLVLFPPLIDCIIVASCFSLTLALLLYKAWGYSNWTGYVLSSLQL